MPTPTTVYEWAIEDQQEVVFSGGSIFFVDNKAVPTDSVLNSGVLAYEPWNRSYANYTLNSHGQWIGHFRSGNIGDTKWVDPSTTVGDMSTRHLGTWDDLGTTTFSMTPAGTETLRLFKKTA